MQVHLLTATQRVPAALDDVWRFFTDPRNLERLTSPQFKFVITSELEGAVYPGMLLTYRVSPLFSIPMTWVTEITHVESGKGFIDEQRFGPYRLWHHEHRFIEIDGGVELVDRIYYALPLPPFGDWFDGTLVRPRLDAMLEYRRIEIDRIFGPAWRH